jgi:hypothetical protein
MNGLKPGGSDRDAAAWAPNDPTDGKGVGVWQTSYPAAALKGIYWETLYLVVLFAAYLAATFYIVHEACISPAPPNVSEVTSGTRHLMFLGFVSAWVGGSMGGVSFGIKWMYHIVARQLWHEDRRLWRLLAPHLSGVVSLFMVFLASSGLLQIFDKQFVERPIAVLAFSFLVGYFSDNALAKMAEMADTLFGGQKKSK